MTDFALLTLDELTWVLNAIDAKVRLLTETPLRGSNEEQRKALISARVKLVNTQLKKQTEVLSGGKK